MSSWLSRNENGEYITEIESLKKCKWKINEVCCNEKCNYLGGYPYPDCKCESKKNCKWFEKEEGTNEVR